MPWKEASLMDLRKEFIHLATQSGAKIGRLCGRFKISSKTAYKWIHRFRQEGEAGLQDRSRQPHHSPRRCEAALEQNVLQLREAHPAWGARKIRSRLQRQGELRLPAVSTVHAILKRYGKVDPNESAQHQAFQRFEKETPNELWQMDFKGHFALGNGQRCHPLTILDDCSRFALCLRACSNEQTDTVQEVLIRVFRRYGLPLRMLMDNGSPWGQDWEHPYTPLTVWLLRLGVKSSHGRPFHPQTQGKEERFHRTLQAEVLRYQTFRDEGEAQTEFDRWREVYNCERPHQALQMQVPADRYQVSARCFPEALVPIEYAAADQVRRVQKTGHISFQGREWRVPKALIGYPVALRPTRTDGRWDIFFCDHPIKQIDLQQPLS